MSSGRFSKKNNEWIYFFWLEELLRSKVKHRSFGLLENLIFHKKWSHAFEINWPLETSNNKLKDYSLLKIVLTFHCSNKLIYWSNFFGKFSAISLEFFLLFSITEQYLEQNCITRSYGFLSPVLLKKLEKQEENHPSW